MEIGRLAIVNERSVRLRRWRYGVNAFEGYVEEILQQLRLPFKSFDILDEALAYEPDLLIAALCEENEINSRKLKQYAEEGGTVISYGGLNHLARELGFFEEGPIGAGYATLPQFSHPLRFLSAHPWNKIPDHEENIGIVPTGQLHQGEPAGKESGPTLLSIKVGRGTIERWSVNIAASIVSLQQGTGPVYDDGPEAPDGTIATREGILKADDRCAMDWKYDRQTTKTGMNYYAYPYADWWRDALIGHLVSVSATKGRALPFLGYWPEGVPAVLAISHDSDLNEDDHAKTTLQLLREIGIQTTWCMLEPGYSSPIYDQIKEDGHDLALHYNALEMDGGVWEEEAFRKQSLWLRRSAQIGRIPSNKNHYTCFEGWGELFRWCERYRIEADQTRGPSKKGNIGFLFGTCHPYFPISDFTEDNRFYDVLEIGFLSQDLNHPELYDATVAEPFLDTVQQNEGVAHFLFHQAHIHTHESVRQAVREVVNGAKKRGFALWTIAEINEWERSRRNVWIAGVDNDGHPVLEGAHLSFPTAVFIPTTDTEPSSDGAYETKFGVICKKYIVG